MAEVRAAIKRKYNTDNMEEKDMTKSEKIKCNTIIHLAGAATAASLTEGLGWMLANEFAQNGGEQ